MNIQLGRYVCEGQAPIVVTSKGTPAEDPLHGPWICYRFEWETPEEASTVFYEKFYALLQVGYRHESEVT